MSRRRPWPSRCSKCASYRSRSERPKRPMRNDPIPGHVGVPGSHRSGPSLRAAKGNGEAVDGRGDVSGWEVVVWGHVLAPPARTPLGAVAPIATEDMRPPCTAMTAAPSSPPSRARSPCAHQTSIDADHSHQALGRTGPPLIAYGGMGRAKGAARHRTPAQTETRLAGGAVGPAALTEPYGQYGGRRRGRRSPQGRRRPHL